jgi:hypothetical protein
MAQGISARRFFEQIKGDSKWLSLQLTTK